MTFSSKQDNLCKIILSKSAFKHLKPLSLLGLHALEVLQRLLVELELLVERVLELRQLHQVQLGQVDGLALALLAAHRGAVEGSVRS